MDEQNIINKSIIDKSFIDKFIDNIISDSIEEFILLNDNISVENYSDNMDNCCIICFEDLNSKQIKKLKCYHIFHEKCIKKWFKNKLNKNNKCPLCNEANNSYIISDKDSSSDESNYYISINGEEEINNTINSNLININSNIQNILNSNYFIISLIVIFYFMITIIVIYFIDNK